MNYTQNNRSCNCKQKNNCACDDSNNNNLLDNTCSYVQNNMNNYYDNCACGFEEEENILPENPMLAQSYVPWQVMDKTFNPEVGLKMGTIFPELVSPYKPCDSMKLIKFIEERNTIGEGCNR